jgi:small conductance mechanosensitive channel
MLGTINNASATEKPVGPPVVREAKRTAVDQELYTLDSAQLRIRVAPLTLQQLEAMKGVALQALQKNAEALAKALIEQLRLHAAAEPNEAIIESVNARIAELVEHKADLISRTNVVLASLKLKGGDVTAAQAYINALAELELETTQGRSLAAPTDAKSAQEALVRERAEQLVAVVRAEPPAHERQQPWAVPLSEFELELQPLPIQSIIERLEKWREILQREVRKRVRIDILLNDAGKLEATQVVRAAADEASGVVHEEVDLADIKARLAERSQEQQAIINQIVRRMEVAAVLVTRRGGDTAPYSKYIAAATGQKLNLTDPSVLRAQVMAWIRSPDGGMYIGLNILKFVGIIFVFWLLSRLLGGITLAAFRRVPNASSLLAPVMVGTVKRGTVIVGLVVGVSMLGVNIGPLLAMIGAAGLVIGLALQGTLSNFASGILILMNRPYDVGHVINAGGVLGKVEAMNLVSTSILTFDNQLMLVPNNQIWNGVITNVTGKPTRRVDLVFGIGYADDMGQAIAIIREVITAHPKVHKEPAPVIRVHELGDNSVNIIARPWAATDNYWEVYWDVMAAVKERFDSEDINIPFPQRDIHLPGPIEVTLSRGEGNAA